MSSYVTSAFLQVHDAQLYAVFGWSQREKQIITQKSWLAILEIFIHEHAVDAAYQAYQKRLPIDAKSQQAIEQCEKALVTDDFVISLAEGKLIVYPQGFKSIVDQGTEIDLSQVSRASLQVLNQLFTLPLTDDLQAIATLEGFTQLVKLLNEIGLLSPAIGEVDWGDFKRKVPICHACGFTRGTPIDRYYLSKFVAEIQDQVVGNVLEVGGVPKDKEFYDFSQRPEYRVLNLEPGPGVDLVGDVHNPALIAPDSLDSVVIFNVLEHCYAPWEAVQNIHRWLKVGGKCFCLVPNAQRLHDRPADYWRPLPDGISLLFKNFAKRKLSVYGNPMSVVGIFHGIATEEMTKEDLDAVHPDYPVITCIVAEK